MVRKLQLTSIAISFVFALGCTRKMDESSQISIKFPSASSVMAQQSVGALSTKWTVSDPTVSSEINCYAVAVSNAGDASSNPNACYNENQATVFRAGVIYGGFAAGTTAQLEVPSGSQKVIRLIGFKTTSVSSCIAVDLQPGGFSTSQFSAPFVLDQVIKDLAPGVAEVELNVPSTIPVANRFEDCAPYSFERTGSVPTLSVTSISPANGADGGGTSVTITGTGFTATTTATIGGAACTAPVITPTTLTCTAGANTPGVADVVVTRGANSSTLSAGFTYVTLPNLSVTDISYSESIGSVSFTVTASATAAMPITFSYATSNGTAVAGTDYTAASGTGNIAVSTGSTTVNLTLANDVLDEDDETFTFTISSPTNAGISQAVATITINDDDTEPTVNMAISSSSANEGATGVVVAVNLSAASGRTVTVPYVVTGTATAAVDHNAVDGTLTFSPGETTKNITFNTLEDAALEDQESVAFALNTPTNGTLGGLLVHTVTINDNEAPTATLAGTPPALTNNNTLAVTVSGTFVTQYRYAVGLGLSCAGATYSAPIAIATPISDVLGADGAYTLCVLGVSSSGAQQLPANATSYNFTLDTTPPTVTLTSPVPVSPTMTRMDVIPMTATFSEPVTGFSAGDLSVSGGAGPTIVNFTAVNATTYKFEVRPGNASAAINVSVSAAVAIDAANNSNAASTPTIFNYSNPPGLWNSVNSSAAPTNRAGASSVWIGTRWFVWGGYDGTSYFNDGALYSPADNSWSVTGLPSAPTARKLASAVFDGKNVLVWGGTNGAALSTGAIYDPTTNAWGTAIITTGAPTARFEHSAHWVGNRMLIWGGWNGTVYTNSGGLYSPGTNSWSPITLSGAPTARARHGSVVTDRYFIVWGGFDGTYRNDGGRYDPAANSWTTIAGSPLIGRSDFAHVWTGDRMIVWGGLTTGATATGDGAIYDPYMNTWTLITATGDIPTPRAKAKSLWTGTHMLVWGGTDSSGAVLNDGYAFEPNSQTWFRLKTNFTVPPRTDHALGWSGSELLVFGGFDPVGPTYHGLTLRMTSFIHFAGNPVPVIKDVSVGGGISCALADGGRAKCWGVNTYGGLGQGNTAIIGDDPGETNTLPIIDFGSSRSALQVAAGGLHACALLDNYQVKCWGRNNYGQLGVGDTIDRGDGPGEMGDSLPYVGLPYKARHVAVGADHSCAVVDTGAVYCWGYNMNGQMGVGTFSGVYNTPVQVNTITDAISVSLGASHSCAHTLEGIRCWGANLNGQLGDGTTTDRNSPILVSTTPTLAIQKVSAGGNTTCLQHYGGGATNMKCWGKGNIGELGNNTVVDSTTPVNSSSYVSRLSMGGSHGCGFNTGGQITCWGSGTFGAIGNNSSGGSPSPSTILGAAASNAIGVSSNNASNCAWYKDNSVKCWGKNDSGRLGRGDTTNPIGNNVTAPNDMNSVINVNLGF